MTTYNGILPDCSTIMKQLGIQANSKHTMQYTNITGGRDSVLMSRIMSRDAVCASNSRSIGHRHDQHISLRKVLNRHDPLPIVLWIFFITDLPPIKGFDSILVVVDQGLTKGVILTPCSKTITSEDTGKLLLENLYKRFRLPDKIISDRGPQFASKSFVKLLKLLGITSALSTAYHPQTDGTTEQVNQEIEAYLSIYCTSHPEDWLMAIHTLEFTHNNRRHADRQSTPFELMFGNSPIAIPYTFKNTKFPNLKDKMKTLQKN